MGIGRQSPYAAFSDKWQLDLSALRHCGMGECATYFGALHGGARAIDSIDALLRPVVETADHPCLGTISIYDLARPVLSSRRFMRCCPMVSSPRSKAGAVIRGADDMVIEFLIANINGMCIAGRGGTDRASLSM